MDASQKISFEEVKIAEVPAEVKSADIQLEERPLGKVFDIIFEKMLSKMSPEKPDCNTFGQSFRLFKPEAVLKPGFPDIAFIRQQYGRGIAALYIFKLYHQHTDGYTHGILVRLQGFVHRRIFEDLIREMIKQFSGCVAQIKAVAPIINKHVSLFDYLQTLYVMPQNLYVNFSHRLDAVSQTLQTKKVENNKTSALKVKMHATISQILDNMLAMPSKYQLSYLSQTLTLDQASFRKNMRMTNISEIVNRIGQDAYNIALQDKSLKVSEVQELMEPLTRRAMLNKCLTDKVTKQVQLLLQQTFSMPFVHPHPYNGIIKCDSASLKMLDGIVFDPRFLFILLLTSRWFLKSCMLEDESTSNNHAHLLLYGGAGTGKTLIVSSISSCIPTYKYLVSTRFQNPDLLQSSILTIDEFDTRQLVNNQYKALLDLKSHVKIDFKNLNPENVTEGMPCMMTTNDDVFSVLRGLKKQNPASVDAGLRRVYAIPMKFGQFEKLHGRVQQGSPLYALLSEYNSKFDSEPNKLERIFHLIMAYALFQQDASNLHMDSRLYEYIRKLVRDFSSSIFGTFYLCNKEAVDQIVTDVEETMKQQDCDDGTYLVKISGGVGQFQQLLNQFLTEILAKIPELNQSVLRDNTSPWPPKAYYLMKNHQFAVAMMWHSINTDAALNSEVKDFLTNPTVQKFASESAADELFADSPQEEDIFDFPQLKQKRTFTAMMGVESEMFQELDLQNQEFQ